MKTLNEVVKIVGLTRRAIQEYEEVGLACKPTTRNKYGHLLYDTLSIERLWKLRFYKELGYNMTAIQKIFNEKTFDTEDELGRVIQKLTEKRDRLDNLISIAQAMKETGISFNSFKKIYADEDADSENVFEILGTSLNLFSFLKEEDYNLDILSEDDWENVVDAMERIMNLQENGESCECKVVQEEVAHIHNIAAKALSKSIILFESYLGYLEPGNKLLEEVEEIYDAEKLNYLRSALSYYCRLNNENEIDNDIRDALENIGILGRKKYMASSPEVQAEVKRIHNFINGINWFKEEIKLEVLKRFGLLYGSKAYKQMIDNGAKKGLSWFISRAIEIYCKKIEENEC